MADTSSGLPPADPDVADHDLDDIVPSRGYQMTPMVALGGSAGSLEALQSFFRALPPDTGMIFVVVTHLSPDHRSEMAALLGRCTSMPVKQAEDREPVEADHVYVIPPGKHLQTLDGHLRLSDLPAVPGRRTTVDQFFRSLADTHGPHASAIVLSGSDSDGAIGIKRVKERGGLTIAQDPDEAQQPGMPRSAIDTGMVDWVLPAAAIPDRLLAYRRHEAQLRLPPEEPPEPPRRDGDDREAALQDVLVFLRTRTGRDFSPYKRATIVRRIARRMQVNGVDDVPGYLGYLRAHPGEAGALLQDLLISVTNFFRDRDAFAALEQRVPDLFRGRRAGEAVRAWVPACATGEEAYSIAMLLLEHARTLDAPPDVQVFACDLNDDAILQARAGLYPETIHADVSEERLARFFARDRDGYRVKRELREVVLFAVHDLLRDAPFSRMDLVSCRNLLIYLDRAAKQRALETFHFALRDEGVLFLGGSESTEDGNGLFRALDKKHRLYARQPAVRIKLPLLDARVPAATAPGRRFAAGDLAAGAIHQAGRMTPSDLHVKLIERYAPPSVVVNSELDVVHLSQHAGRFLQLTGGEPTNELTRIVHPALRLELRSALYRASQTDQPVRSAGTNVELGGRTQVVTIEVAPAQDLAPGFLLVTFEARDLEGGGHDAVAAPAPSDEPLVRHLERELEQVKRYLRDTVEQYETSSEEMKSSNEELQAMNEELRSATEELETSREELQSINEELTAVNHEMKTKVDELAHANSDLQNLMAATSIATVFLDRELRIMRYTPSAAAIFHLIPGDLGRPLAHLQHGLDYPELLTDAAQVLGTLAPIEREVRGEGRWYLARSLPYRTAEDRIAGVVLTFVDIPGR